MKKNNLQQVFSNKACSTHSILNCKIFMLFLLFFSISILWANAEEFQQSRITGKVTDSKTGDPIPGVNIIVQGTVAGAITDANGNYSINVPGPNSVLVYSFISYVVQSITVGNQSVIDVALVEEVTALDEVVVVGYGTQKKINLTGSVAATTSEVLVKRATTNAANLLQGQLAGLEVIQSSGMPNRDDALIQVRGLGTFSSAGSAPLVLVDGIIGSMSNLAPNDIESVTVLKDAASASIYGARAANGVILVTTKQAKKGAFFEYQIDVGVHNPTVLPDLITNSAEYMQMMNTARTRAGQAVAYTQEQIDAYKNATDREQYPNFDWIDYLYNPATVINNYLSFSNVGEKTSYKVSFNILNQDGILPDIAFKKYNAQINTTSKLTKAITVGTNLNFKYSDNDEPWVNPGFSASMVHGAVYQNAPLYKPFLPDGSGRKVCWAYPNEAFHDVRAPVIFQDITNNRKNYALNGQIYLDIELLKGLKWTTKAAVNFSDNKSKFIAVETHDHYYYHKLPGETDYTLNAGVSWAREVTDNYNRTILPVFNTVLNYETKIGTDNNLRAMVGFEQQSYYYEYIAATRLKFPTNDLNELNAGSSTGQSLGGTSNGYALRGFFGRLGYDFRGKYLIEANARYDGTSRVAEANRWGFFPSVSAGWRISEESFLKDNVNWLSDLKVRGSYGILGNQEIGNYPYQKVLSLASYPMDAAYVQAAQYTRLTDENLKWESTRIFDIGLDMEIKKGLFGLTFDWFNKYTYDILTSLPVPISLGISGPVTNDGEMQNVGYEVELRHRNQIGEINYDVRFMVSHYVNELKKIAVPTVGINEVGLPYNSFFIYEMEGIFQSQADIEGHATQIYNQPKPGDIKIKDQNDDGTVDSKDRISLSPYPNYTYSFGLNIGWKGLNLSAFFQGVQGVYKRPQGWGFDPFIQGDAPSVRFRDGWSETNPSNTIPTVYYGWGYSGVYGYPSTFNVVDASYLRLKNLNLSYTFPKKIADKIFLQELTVFVSGDNLITFSKFKDLYGLEPESVDAASGSSSTVVAGAYPQVRILNAGLKIKF
jgi:TonB-linked SusC/RagA family outer membrane protein